MGDDAPASFLRVIVNPTVKQKRQLRNDDAEACVLVAHRHPSTEEVVDFLGASAPRRVLGEPLPMYFSIVADGAGLRLLSPRDGGSPHLTVPWAEVVGIARGSVAIRGGTVAALNVIGERASRSYEL
ncbi:hypothetical protein QCD70_06205 [Agreia sp. PsM10]|uniref:hypothetical protein n=1 Tax=Agreia sp. PsM10 TaxID=3030533 RepID=UPI00263AD104|nr:hypothetical protein [Agreia sp. PsM10]MDN4639827.1 hypothetical protein [Agreia sp. PsM10]